MHKYYTIGVCLVLGGCMVEKTTVDKHVQEEIQRAVVMRIVEMYEPVTSVTFGTMKRVRTTGGWHGEVVVNHQDRLSVSFSYNTVNKTVQMVHQVVDRVTVTYRKTSRKDLTLNGVTVTYGALE